MAKRSRSAIIAARRQKVAQLALRGLTQREIVEVLEKERIVNPDTGKPFSLGTINDDLQQLEAEWELDAVAAIGKRKARVTAELLHLRRWAWSQRDGELVLDTIKEEIDLYQLSGPVQASVTLNLPGANGQQQQITAYDEDIAQMDEMELDQFLLNMMARAQLPDVVEGDYSVVGRQGA